MRRTIRFPMWFWDKLVDHNQDIRAILLASLASLVVINVVGIIFGYNAIAKMQAYHYPPFGKEDWMHAYSLTGSALPDCLLLFWASWVGHAIIWSSIVIVPVSCVLLLRKGFVGVGFVTMLFWTALTGVVGVWTWIFGTMIMFY